MADVRGVRLLSDLNNAFRRDPNIDEYDFLPVLEPKHNKSPLILIEHKLGLERWSIKVLYQFAYNKLMAWRAKETSSKFLDSCELMALTRAVLLVNPDVYTAWNVRKELIETGELTIADDLKLGALILTRHPKSTETFIHRRWLLERLTEQCLSSSLDSNASNNSVGGHHGNLEEVLMDAINVNLPVEGNPQPPLPRDNAPPDAPLPPGVQGNNHLMAAAGVRELQGLLVREMVVCQRAAEGYTCNYHAWSHRSWVVQHCYNCSIQLMLSELQNTKAWVSMNVSDHSGFQYRQFLLTKLLGKAATLLRTFSILGTDLLDKEMHLVLDLLRSYPGHEALWYHRRFVFQSLMEGSRRSRSERPLQAESNREDNCARQQGLKRSRLESDAELLLLKEVDLVSENEAKSKYKEQQRLAQNYLDWLHKVFNC